MSYSIKDGIRELEQGVQTYKQILERFPDAYQDNEHYWVSKLLKPEDCDHVQVGKHDVVRVGTLVGGTMVARPLSMGAWTTAVLLFKLKEESPEQFRALALFAAGVKK